MRLFGKEKTLERLDQMVTDALNGNFCEENYDETQLSRLESKWKQYLSSSKMSMEQTEKERENIKSMISDISHQTRTPLSNIRLYAELLQERISGQEEQEMARQMREQAEKLEFLIQALVKMSRLESDILEVKPVRQPVEPLISGVLDAVGPKADQKGIKITVSGDRSSQAVYDLKWTLEALYNVLDNSVKYSHKGSRIQIFLRQYQLYYEIQVKDEGIGIKESERAQIFQRFYRGQEVQQADGVGIGLYLTREILRKERGYIKVESVYGQGSSFKVYLAAEI